jgi:phosphoglycerate dehydrogenase-like enzyme
MDTIHIANFLQVPESALDVIRAVDPRIEIYNVSPNLARYMREPDHPQVNVGAAIEEGVEIQQRDRIWFTFFSGELAGEATALEWIALASAGANQILDRPIGEDVVITKMPGLAARVIGEWVLTFMLMDVKRMIRLIEAHRAGTWARSDPETLEGATVGIIGYGAIGSEIARFCDAFGARVVGIRRRASGDGSPPPDAPESVAYVWPPERLNDVLSESDYVVLAVPLTADTYHLIGEQELAAMKPGAALINIARGEVVDWDAQVAALDSGRLRASYTDVTSPEPLPDGHPLWSVPSLFITPHNSGLQPNYFGKAAYRFADNLRRFINDEPLRDVVDRHAGY